MLFQAQLRAANQSQNSGIEHIWQESWRVNFYRGGPVFMSASAGINIALWDLKGDFAWLCNASIP
jgi:galactonate dehydratase